MPLTPASTWMKESLVSAVTEVCGIGAKHESRHCCWHLHSAPNRTKSRAVLNSKAMLYMHLKPTNETIYLILKEDQFTVSFSLDLNHMDLAMRSLLKARHLHRAIILLTTRSPRRSKPWTPSLRTPSVPRTDGSSRNDASGAHSIHRTFVIKRARRQAGVQILDEGGCQLLHVINRTVLGVYDKLTLDPG